MAVYSYQAMNQKGKTLRGTIEAEDREDAKMKLRGENLLPVSVTQQSIFTRDWNIQIGGYPKPRDLSVMCRQFVSMLQAGVGIVDIMRIMCEQTENKRLKDALREVRIEVEKGESFSTALAKYPKIFPTLFIHMTSAGEASGNLDVAMERIALQMEKAYKTRSLVKKALIYPCILVSVAIVITILMLVFVIPSYEVLFQDLGTELPTITLLYMQVSRAIRNDWFLIFPAIFLLVLGMMRFCKTNKGKHCIDKLAIKIPIVKHLVIKSNSAQMARTMGTLLSSGIPLVAATEMVSDTLDNIWFQEAMMEAKEQITLGVSLSTALQENGLFPPLVYHMLRIGEEAGQTEEMLSKLAQYYDEEVEMSVQTVMAAMEPAIIIVMAILVGGLVAACMAPMVKMYAVLETI